jgi:hypothetical protein
MVLVTSHGRRGREGEGERGGGWREERDGLITFFYFTFTSSIFRALSSSIHALDPTASDSFHNESTKRANIKSRQTTIQ